MENFQKLKKVITELVGDQNLDIKIESKLKYDLSLNSIKIMYLIDSIESEFGFNFNMEDFNDKNFSTIQSILSLIELRSLN